MMESNRFIILCELLLLAADWDADEHVNIVIDEILLEVCKSKYRIILISLR